MFNGFTIIRFIIVITSVLMAIIVFGIKLDHKQKEENKPPVLSEMIPIEVGFTWLDNNTAIFVKNNNTYKIKKLNCDDYNNKHFINSDTPKPYKILIDSTNKQFDYNSICAIIK